MGNEADRTAKKIEDLGKGFSPLLTAATALGPALIPVMAGVTAAAGGLGVAVASSGAAMAVFGAVAKTSLKSVQENAKKAADGTADLSGPLGAATRGYLALGDAWDRFVAHNQPRTFQLLGAGFSILTTAIPKLQPLFDVASASAARFEGQLSHFVSGGGMDRLVRFLSANAGPALEAFRQTITNVGTGLGALLPQFARFSGGVEAGLVGLSAKFAEWAQGAAGPGGSFQKFFDFVVGTAPTVVATFKDLAEAAINIVHGLTPLGPVSLTFVGAMAKLISVLPPGVVTGIAAGFLGVQVALKGAAIAAQLFNRSFGATPIGLVAAALSGLIAVFVHHSQVVAESRQAVADYQSTLDKATGAITENTRAMAGQKLQAAGALDAAQKLGLGLSTVTDAALGNVGAQAQVNAAISNAIAAFDAYDGSGQAVSKTISDQSAAAVELRKALGDAGVQIAGSQAAQRQLAAATQPTTVAIVSQKQAAADAARALDRLSASLLKTAGVNLNAAQASIAFRNSLDSLSQSVHDNGHSLDQNTVKGRANRSAVLDSISSALQYANAVGEQTHSQTRAQQAFQASIPAIQRQAASLGLNKAQVDALIRSIGGLRPKTVPINVTVTGAAAVQRTIDSISGHVVAIQTGLVRGVGVMGHAAGTPSAPPGLAWVGEAGPELMRFKGGEQVMDALTSRRVARGFAGGTGRPGSVINVYVSGVVGDGQAVARQVRDDLRKVLRGEGKTATANAL